MPALFDLDARFRAMDTRGRRLRPDRQDRQPPGREHRRPGRGARAVAHRQRRDGGARGALPGPVHRRRRVPADERRRRGARRARSRRRQLGLCGVQIYTDCSGRAARRPAVRAAVRSRRRARHSGPAASGSRPRPADYPPEDGRAASTRWRVYRLAVRHRLRDGAARLFRTLRSAPEIKIVTHHLGGFAPYASGAHPRGLRQAAQGRAGPRTNRCRSKKHPVRLLPSSSTPTRSRLARCRRSDAASTSSASIA